MHEVVPEWDANFVDIEQELLFELILVSRVPGSSSTPCGSNQRLFEYDLFSFPGRKLHGHQEPAGPHLRKGGINDQG